MRVRILSSLPPICCSPAGRGSIYIQQGSVRLAQGDGGVLSYTGTQSVENKTGGIQGFITIMDEYKTSIKKGSVLRLKGVGGMDMISGRG